MSSLFAKLNLSPQERRLVVFVGLFLFLVLNLWLVWPHFGDLGIWQQRLRDMRGRLHQYQVEIQKQNTYERERQKLREAGQALPEEKYARELLRQVQRQATTSGVHLITSAPGRGGATTTTSTNFFDEETVLVTFESGPKELIDFLYNLGAHGSLIRVRSMTLNPDPPTRSKLSGQIQLVESFAKTAPGKPAPTAAPAGTAATPRPQAPGPAPAATPVATPATAPTAVTPAHPTTVPGLPNSGAPAAPPAFPEKTKSSAPTPPRPQRIQPTNSNSGVVIPKRRLPTPPPGNKSS